MIPSEPASRPRHLVRLLHLLFGIALLGACAGDGCSCGAFEQDQFPTEHADKTLPKSGQVRITESGLDFFEKNIPSIIKQVRPEGLSFCIDKQSRSVADICTAGTCSDGTDGCQLDLSLENADIEPVPSDDELDLEIDIGELNEKIPFDPPAVECEADLHQSGADTDVAATVTAVVPITFEVDDQLPTNDTSIQLGEVEANLENLDFDLSGRDGFGDDLACGGIDLVKGLVEDQIKQEMKAQVNRAIQDAARGQLCRTCGQNEPDCPSESTCEEADKQSYCQWNNRDRCVPRTLGAEGRLVLDEPLGDLLESDEAATHVMAKAADLAEVDSSPGVNLGMRTGFQPTATGDCVPIEDAQRPDFGSIPRSPAILTNTRPDNGDSFMLGVGVHRRALQHLFWSIWGSEGLCLKIDSSFNELLSTASLRVFIGSLERLTDREGPVFVRLTPQTPPDVTLGENEIVEENGSYRLDEPLMTVDWSDVDMHFYAFLQDRYTRIFTARLDLEVPVGLTSAEDQLRPVTGDLNDAPRNIRIRNDGILAEDTSTLKDLVPTLLDAALPQLTDSLTEPIELPSFFGLQVMFEEDDITSVRNGTFLALYGDLAPAGQMASTAVTARPTIRDTSVDTSPTTPTGVPRPVLRVDLGATGLGRPLGPDADIEFSSRVDGGSWSLFTSDRRLVLRDPVLTLPGRHEVEVRARPAGRTGAASEPVATTVTVDYEPPSLSLEQSGDTLHADADDTVDPESRLRYRYRVDDGSWGEWTAEETFGLDDLDPIPVDVTVQVRDSSGRIAEETTRVDPGAGPADESQPASPPHGSSDGCRTSDGSVPLAPLGLLLFLPMMASSGRRRRLLSVLALGGLLLAAGCSDPSGGDRFACDTADDCSCPDEVQTAACIDGQCTCGDFCSGGCGDREYCCYAEDACRGLPDPCRGESCRPGFEPTLTDEGDIDRSACSVSGASCACREKPPLDLEWYGKHTSLDARGDTVAASTYNRAFGDLMVGVIDESGEPTWFVPAGAPEEGTVVAAPSGPRGGIEEEGPDVGAHSAIAVDGAGQLHVVYRDMESGREGLYYLRGTREEGTWSFSDPVAVDTEGETGLYTSAEVAGGTLYATWGVRSIETADRGKQTQIRHIALPVDADVGSLSPEPSVAYSSDPLDPCKGSCSGDEVCFRTSATCAEPADTCDNCPDGQTCRETGMGGTGDGTCKPVFTAPSTPGHRLMTGLYTETLVGADRRVIVFYDRIEKQVGLLEKSGDGDGAWRDPQFLGEGTGPRAGAALDGSGELHVASMDADDKRLLYFAPGAESPIEVTDGIRESKAEYVEAAIGHDVDLWLASDGTPRLIFQDASRHTLHSATRTSDGWSVSTVAPTGDGDADSGAHGFYADATSTSDGPLIAEMIIDQTSDPATARLKFQSLQ